MQALVADPTNAGQVDAWDGKEGAFFTAHADQLDRALAHAHHRFVASADVQVGERVLDVGCGTGQATRDCARAAGNGSAIGVDLSSDMLAFARAAAAADGLTNVEFGQADAQIYPFDAGGFDVVVSRLGSMFFGDPVVAFTNLRRALRAGGRLALLTWQGLAENEWLTEFRRALADGRDLPAPPADGPSMLGLSDPERVSSILTPAGFTDVAFTSVHAPMYFGADTAAAFDYVTAQYGWMLAGLDHAGRHRALAALYASLAAHTDAQGVTFDSATWIIEARSEV